MAAVGHEGIPKGDRERPHVDAEPRRVLVREDTVRSAADGEPSRDHRAVEQLGLLRAERVEELDRWCAATFVATATRNRGNCEENSTALHGADSTR